MTRESEQELPVSQSFLVFLKSLLKKWPLFCIVGLVFGIAGFIYAWAQAPKYESNLTFVLNQGDNSGISGALSLAAIFVINLNNLVNVFFSGYNIL
jgi:uncharacterized protein involved in exopolysaccharide biosynthesis